MSKLQKAIDRLAALIENGELLAATDSVDFIIAVETQLTAAQEYIKELEEALRGLESYFNYLERIYYDAEIVRKPSFITARMKICRALAKEKNCDQCRGCRAAEVMEGK